MKGCILTLYDHNYIQAMRYMLYCIVESIWLCSYLSNSNWRLVWEWPGLLQFTFTVSCKRIQFEEYIIEKKMFYYRSPCSTLNWTKKPVKTWNVLAFLTKLQFCYILQNIIHILQYKKDYNAWIISKGTHTIYSEYYLWLNVIILHETSCKTYNDNNNGVRLIHLSIL